MDDDGWLDIYDNFEDLIGDLEAPFLDEIAWLVDGKARAVRLTARGDRIELAGMEPAVDQAGLYEAIDRFFDRWTMTSPPPHCDSESEYIASVAAQYRTAEFRPRKRKDR
ncbi:hypothetical protein [Kribbella hippodromi]|uniref:hypothetical protein n=1 Tax=Kribbella hippodromi TaxID=434347 RepID=UPI0031DC8AD7